MRWSAKRKDGSNVEIQVVATVVRDNDRKAIAIMGSALDITDRKRAEQALRESEGKYRSLFEESRDAVIMTTRDGVLEDANQAFFDLFGFTREEVQGMDILNIYLDPADRLRFRQDIERDGSVKDYPVKRRKKDGTEIDCLLTAAARRSKDGTITWLPGYHQGRHELEPTHETTSSSAEDGGNRDFGRGHCPRFQQPASGYHGLFRGAAFAKG